MQYENVTIFIQSECVYIYLLAITLVVTLKENGYRGC